MKTIYTILLLFAISAHGQNTPIFLNSIDGKIYADKSYTTSIGDILEIRVLKPLEDNGTIAFIDVDKNNFLHDKSMYFTDIYTYIKSIIGDPTSYDTGDNGNTFVIWDGIILGLMKTETGKLILLNYTDVKK